MSGPLLGSTPGRSSQWKQATSGDSSSSGSKCRLAPRRPRLIALEGLEQASRSRSGQLSRTARSAPVGRLVDQLADHGQIDGFGPGPRARSSDAGPPGRRHGRPARAGRARDCGRPATPRHGIGGEQVEGGGGRAPEPFVGPVERVVELVAAGPAHRFGGLEASEYVSSARERCGGLAWQRSERRRDRLRRDPIASASSKCLNAAG